MEDDLKKLEDKLNDSKNANPFLSKIGDGYQIGLANMYYINHSGGIPLIKSPRELTKYSDERKSVSLRIGGYLAILSHPIISVKAMIKHLTR